MSKKQIQNKRLSYLWKGKGVGITIIAFVIAVVFLYPVMIAVINSFKSKGEILHSAIAFPSHITLGNYSAVIEAAGFVEAFINSCIVTLGSIILNLLVSTLAGYSLERWRSKWAHILTLVFLSSMFVPFHTIMITLLKAAKGLRLTGHILGLVIIYSGLQCSIPIFLIKGFIHSLPVELEEAATVDGCNIYMLLGKIVIPLLKPILATIAVLNALWTWNDYLLPYLILGKPITIPLSQMYFYGQYNQQWHLIMAGFVVSTVPVVVFFLFMQKYIINGIAAGAVKG